jgi:hypothetical protein
LIDLLNKGKVDHPMFYMGHRMNNHFVFDKFGRDSNAIKNEEADDRAENYTAGKFILGLK